MKFAVNLATFLYEVLQWSSRKKTALFRKILLLVVIKTCKVIIFVFATANIYDKMVLKIFIKTLAKPHVKRLYGFYSREAKT